MTQSTRMLARMGTCMTEHTYVDRYDAEDTYVDTHGDTYDTENTYGGTHINTYDKENTYDDPLMTHTPTHTTQRAHIAPHTTPMTEHTYDGTHVDSYDTAHT